ncbi:hypothetical protein BH11PLA1_BH11PLA1_11520 [soil metagenome]
MKTIRPLRLPGLRRAFSLIEVLMATLVLGLGLLGLGAVLPVIVRQQSVSVDGTVGGSAMQSAVRYIEGNKDLSADRWKNFVLYYRDSPAQETMRQQTWIVPFVEPTLSWTALFPRAIELVAPTGTINANTRLTMNESTDFQYISLSDRLYPTEAGGDSGPQFVWDLAARRDFQGGGVQLAVFLRRVDAGVDRGVTGSVYNVLLNSTSAAYRRPVNVDTAGRPTLDARAPGVRYSSILTANVSSLIENGVIRRDRLVVNDVIDRNANGDLQLMDIALGIQLAAQPGQKLVDNLGNIYTVEGLDDSYANSRVLRLSSSVPLSATFFDDPALAPEDTRDNTRPRRAVISQVVFTPQIPVAVEILNKKFDLPADPFSALTPGRTSLQP